MHHFTDEELAARGLPEKAFIDNARDQSTGAPRILGVKRGESGYYPIFTGLSADELNAMHGVSAAQREAMYFGSLFGWEVPGAYPEAWTRHRGASIADIVQKAKAAAGRSA